MDSGFLKTTLVFLMIFCVSYGHGGACKKCQQITTYVNGHRVCSCEPGYVISSADRSQCVDINECEDSVTNPCGQICNNTEGSYICSCEPGYALNSTDNATCYDINECEDSVTNPCGQICSNTEGSYICSCEPGYALNSADNVTCYDINECQQTPSPCDQICTNTNGSYSCSCEPRFALNTDNATCSSICASYDIFEKEFISSNITKKECFDKCAADPFCYFFSYFGTDGCSLYKASGNLTDFEKDKNGFKIVICQKNIASKCLPFSQPMDIVTADETLKDCFNSCSKTQYCYVYQFNQLGNGCKIVTGTGTVDLNIDNSANVIVGC